MLSFVTPFTKLVYEKAEIIQAVTSIHSSWLQESPQAAETSPRIPNLSRIKEDWLPSHS